MCRKLIYLFWGLPKDLWVEEDRGLAFGEAV